MSDQQQHRVEVLLAIRQREEDDARRVFDHVRGREDFHRRRIAELEGLLAAQTEEARRRLVAGEGGEAASTYRAAVAELRRAIGEQRALLRPLEPMVEKGRAEVMRAVSRRKAAAVLRDRLLGRRSALLARAETRQIDDAHAVRLAAADQAGA